jgi:hypothetical protein
MDRAETLGPGSAQELHEDGFGLIIQSVGSKDGIGVTGGEKGVKESVADLSGGLFDGLAVLSGAGRNVGMVNVQRDVELDAEVLNEGEVGVGFGGLADSVVDVDGRESNAE